MLGEIRKGRNRSVDDLIDQILVHGHLDFTRYQPAEGDSTNLVPCSRESVLRVIETVETLKLFDSSTMKLTPLGLRGADPRYFDDVIVKSIPNGLNKLGTSMKAIRAVIGEILGAANSTTLPTAEAIFDRLMISANAKSRDQFKSYLSLLGACKGIHFSRKKIYLAD